LTFINEWFIIPGYQLKVKHFDFRETLEEALLLPKLKEP